MHSNGGIDDRGRTTSASPSLFEFGSRPCIPLRFYPLICNLRIPHRELGKQKPLFELDELEMYVFCIRTTGVIRC